jgi:acyl CoA:acetate/3-ketoacid CoA transferase
MSSKIVSAAEAVALIPDGAVVAVNSSSGLNTPNAVLRAIGEAFESQGRPRNLHFFLPIAAGDMYGVDGIDHVAKPGLLARVIAGSYPSGPSNRESPKIWQMIGADQVPAYNVPSGILFDMIRNAAGKRAGVFTKVGLDTFIDPRRQGAKMNKAAKDDIVKLVEMGGEEWLHFPNIPPDVAIIRGTTADEKGNISMEHEGGYLGALDVALAARTNGGFVIAQVKRVTTAGSIPPQRVFVPSTMVDFVVVDPDQWQTTETPYDPAISGEVRRPFSSFPPVTFDAEKAIARRATLELCAGDAVNLGFGISPIIPRILIEEGQAEAVTWVIEQGAVGGVPLDGFAFGCSANAQAIIPSPTQFTYFQSGGEDCGLLSFMEVSSEGDVNVSRLASKPHVTAGVGGFIDITSHGRKLVFSGFFTAGGLKLDLAGGKVTILQEGKFPKFVEEVEHVTFSGRRSRTLGQDITYVTERCVVKLMPEGLVVTEIAPGIDVKRDVLGQARARMTVSPNLKEMDGRLFRPEPMGLVLPERTTPRFRSARS